MGVAAQLSLDPGLRRAREVLGHDDGRAPHERERRSHHARVPEWHELLNPVPGLRLEEVDRVRPTGRRLPFCMAAPRDCPTRGAPALMSLLMPRGRRRCRKREVRVLLGFHGFSFYDVGILRVPGMISPSARPTACGTEITLLAVTGGRSSSRRLPARLRFVAGHRPAPGSTGLFER